MLSKQIPVLWNSSLLMWCIQHHPILTKFQIVYIQYNYLSPNFLKSFWQHKVPTRIELKLDFPNLRQEGAKNSRCGLALGTEGTPSSRATSIKQGELKGNFIPANILLDLSFFLSGLLWDPVRILASVKGFYPHSNTTIAAEQQNKVHQIREQRMQYPSEVAQGVKQTGWNY